MKKSITFQIRCYGWLELAQLYSPNISAASATRRLGRWIELHPPLKQKLLSAGWQKGNRILTPRHVTILVEHLGEP